MSAGRLLAVVRTIPPRRLDLLAALVIGAEMQVEAVLSDPGEGREPLVHLLLLLLGVALAVRRRWPVAAFVAAQVPFVAVQAMGATLTDTLYVPLFVVLFLNYSAAANARDRRFWAVPPLALASGLTAMAVDDHPGAVVDDLLWIGLIFVTAPCVAGRLVLHRSRLQRALHHKAERLESERAERSQAAVAEERTRIAGELHDIVAHALSEMTVQASAAGRLAASDPARAAEAFAAVEGRGRDALGELRRLLGVLRRDDEELALAPQPSLRHLDSLVRRAGAAGLPVALRVEGDAMQLPAGIDVTGYRVVQEALRCAREAHAAGRAGVRVRYAPRLVELEVSDDGAQGAGPDGRMLLGLRERVALYGGDFHVGAGRDGGHLVRARLPVEPTT